MFIMKKLWFCLLTLTLVLIPQIALADGADFTVSTVKNQYQSTTSNGYFSLKMPAQSETTLQLTVYNFGKESAMFNISVNSGITGINTSLDYSKIPGKGVLSVPKILQFSHIASLPQKEITVGPNSSMIVPIDLKLPDTSFSGKLLGGITITRYIRDDEKKATGLTSQFSYAVPIVIHQTDYDVTPKLEADHLRILTENHNNYLASNIKNVTPTILNGVKIKSELLDHSSTAVFSKTDKNHSIAPQSNFTYRILLGNKSFATGKYTYRITMTDNEHHKWQWQQQLAIDKKKYHIINNTAKHNTLKKPINWVVVGLVIMIAIVIILSGVLGILLLKH